MSISTIPSHDGALVEIRLDRPRVHNALDGETLDALQRAVEDADRSGARVILLSGEGKSFCSGADRRHYPGYAGEAGGQHLVHAQIGIGNRVCRALAQTNAITLARLHGHVLGGGLALALACDMRLAADDAVLGLPEVELAVPLGWGALYRLSALVGRMQAMEFLLTPRRVSGEEAWRLGLANASAPAQGLDALVETRTAHLLGLDPAALLLTKLQFKALSAREAQGDLETIDGTLLLCALRGGAYASFLGDKGH